MIGRIFSCHLAEGLAYFATEDESFISSFVFRWHTTPVKVFTIIHLVLCSAISVTSFSVTSREPSAFVLYIMSLCFEVAELNYACQSLSMHRTKEKFRPISEELGDWFVSLHTEKNECLLLLIGNVWLRMLPKPIDSYEYHIRIKPSYRGGDAAYLFKTPHVLCRKTHRECAIHVVVTGSRQLWIPHHPYFILWIGLFGQVGENVGESVGVGWERGANCPPPQQHSSQ